MEIKSQVILNSIARGNHGSSFHLHPGCFCAYVLLSCPIRSFTFSLSFPVCSLLQTPTRFPCVPFCVNPSVPFALPQGFPPTLPCFRCWSPARFILYCTVRFELRIVFAMRFPCVPVFNSVQLCSVQLCYGLSRSFSPVYDDLKIIHFWVVSTSVSKRVNVHNLSYWNSFPNTFIVCKSNSFPNEKMCQTRTRVKSNSKMLVIAKMVL